MIINKFRNLILGFLTFFFGVKILYKFNLSIIKIFSTFIGNNLFFSFKVSGEEFFLKKICDENPKLCIDIGANVGNFSKYILRNSNSKVLAFEPHKKSFKELKKLKKLYSNRIDIFNFGLSDKNKSLNLYYDKNNSLWANFNPEVHKIDYLKNNKLTQKCKVKKLDEVYFKSKNSYKDKIKLIKIDTEGYEYEVLNGAQKFIKKNKPKYILIEFNWHHLFKNVSLYKISKLLDNYQVFKILPHSSGLLEIDPVRPENNIYNYSNYVFKIKKNND